MTPNRGRSARDLIALQTEAIHRLTQESVQLAERPRWVSLLEVAAVFVSAAFFVAVVQA